MAAFLQIGTNLAADATEAAQSGNIRTFWGANRKTRDPTFNTDQTVRDTGISNTGAMTVGAGVATLFVGSATTFIRIVGTLGIQINLTGGTAQYTFNSADPFFPVNAGIQGLNSSTNMTIICRQPGNNRASMGRMILRA